ncbi:unnamed protein product [Nesidiocoris tenuis]|uniref:Uncharacterized protein n=1 Tax=Nesidiocoris tenuis TaxID=355587 RepID=A0A6H5GPI7_9HEMI|nr:unnamed protein product [Nesidiocoris tenuis]
MLCYSTLLEYKFGVWVLNFRRLHEALERQRFASLYKHRLFKRALRLSWKNIERQPKIRKK